MYLYVIVGGDCLQLNEIQPFSRTLMIRILMLYKDNIIIYLPRDRMSQKLKTVTRAILSVKIG